MNFWTLTRSARSTTPSPSTATLYVVDRDGLIGDEHFGEGRHEESEREIQRLLGRD